MDHRVTKIKDTIREGLCLAYAKRKEAIKATQNPYVNLQEDLDYQVLLNDTNIIYDHLVMMGVIKL